MVGPGWLHWRNMWASEQEVPRPVGVGIHIPARPSKANITSKTHVPRDWDWHMILHIGSYRHVFRDQVNMRLGPVGLVHLVVDRRGRTDLQVLHRQEGKR